jgi:hypothetical protein
LAVGAAASQCRAEQAGEQVGGNGMGFGKHKTLE